MNRKLTIAAWSVKVALVFWSLVSAAYGVDRVTVVRLATEGDAVRTYGATLGAGVTGNADILTAAIANRANKYPLGIPAGYFALDETIVTPSRLGYSIFGAGHQVGKPDPSYTSSDGGAVTRLVWEGNSTDAMLQYNGFGGVIENVGFQGREFPGVNGLEEATGTSDPKAAVGINVRTYNDAGSFPCGKVAIRDVSFVQVKTCILFGKTSGVSTENNADESIVENARFLFPYSTASETRKGIHVNNSQSAYHHFSDIWTYGNLDDVVYLERGAAARVSDVHVIGATSTSKPVNLLHLGAVSTNTQFSLENFAIDGSAGGTDQIGNSFHVLQMDAHASGNVVVNISNGSIHPVIYITPIFICRGGCTVTIRGVTGLNPASIRLIGGLSNAAVCNVNLENCTLRDCDWPTDLIEGSSAGPYRLTWRNCTRLYKTGEFVWGRPFTDGASAFPTSGSNAQPLTQP